MKKQIVKFVVVGGAALLIPPVLAIPPVQLSFDTVTYILGAMIIFYIITCLTARREYKKKIALLPLVFDKLKVDQKITIL